MFGSAEIISFLFKTYGPGEAAIPNNLKGKAAGGGGGGKGAKVKPITLYAP